MNEDMLNVVESRDEHVYGLLFELDSDDEARLDGYEGVPESYEKQFHSVTTLNDEKIKDALVYVDVQRVQGGYKAKEEYISRMNKAIDDGLKEGVPNEYVEKVLRPYIPEQ
ncbi:hypothetical protein DL96DRAFT_1228967 [Flagelloscypha sp. PMI_526]|nr:hypothetical protein DL96DRAFT_1228967 [Flagelloscypha sp. PMI_526]